MQIIKGDQVTMGAYALILQIITCLAAAAGVHKRVNPCLARAPKSLQWQQRVSKRKGGRPVWGWDTPNWSTSLQWSRAHRDTLTALPRGPEETLPSRVESPGQEVCCNLIMSLFLWFQVTGDFYVWNKQVIHQTKLSVTQGLGAMLVNTLG